jgi:hypothetical protein
MGRGEKKGMSEGLWESWHIFPQGFSYILGQKGMAQGAAIQAHWRSEEIERGQNAKRRSFANG